MSDRRLKFWLKHLTAFGAVWSSAVVLPVLMGCQPTRPVVAVSSSGNRLREPLPSEGRRTNSDSTRDRDSDRTRDNDDDDLPLGRDRERDDEDDEEEDDDPPGDCPNMVDVDLVMIPGGPPLAIDAPFTKFGGAHEGRDYHFTFTVFKSNKGTWSKTTGTEPRVTYTKHTYKGVVKRANDPACTVSAKLESQG